jgi:hypothetical protein
MTKTLVLTIGLLYFHTTQACDVCGSGIRDASFNMGFAQSMKKNMLFTGIHTFHYVTQAADGEQTYNVSDRIIRIPTLYVHQNSKKWQTQIQYDLQYISRNNAYNEQTQFHQFSPGDLSISGIYRVIDTRNFFNQKHSFLWLAGTTLKLPTGHYQIRDSKKRILPMQLQAGNGAYGLGLNTSFAYRYKRMGIHQMVQTMIHAPNESQYQQGQQIQYQMGINAVFQPNASHTLIPMVSFLNQHFQVDQSFNSTINSTGGNWQSVVIQCEWIYQNVYMMPQFQFPILSKIPENAPQIMPAFQIRLGYLFDEKQKWMETTEE